MELAAIFRRAAFAIGLGVATPALAEPDKTVAQDATTFEQIFKDADADFGQPKQPGPQPQGDLTIHDILKDSDVDDQIARARAAGPDFGRYGPVIEQGEAILPDADGETVLPSVLARSKGYSGLDGNGFYSMVAENPDWEEGAGRTGAMGRFRLTDEKMALLTEINDSVNANIYETDDVNYGQSDYWAPIEGKGIGDCEDYAVSKRKALIERGVNQNTLSIAMVNVPGYGAHAVLLAATFDDKTMQPKDMVLDIFRKQIVPADQTGFEFVAVTSRADPSVMHLVRQPDMPAHAPDPASPQVPIPTPRPPGP